MKFIACNAATVPTRHNPFYPPYNMSDEDTTTGVQLAEHVLKKKGYNPVSDEDQRVTLGDRDEDDTKSPAAKKPPPPAPTLTSSPISPPLRKDCGEDNVDEDDLKPPTSKDPRFQRKLHCHVENRCSERSICCWPTRASNHR